MPVVLHLRYNRVNGFYSPILDLQSTTTTSSLVEVGSEKGFLKRSFLFSLPPSFGQKSLVSLSRLQKLCNDGPH